MKRASLVALTLGVIAATHSTAERTASAQPPVPPAAASVPAGIPGPSSVFAFDLFARVRSDRNVLVGPGSLRTALSMTAVGARGATAAQMTRVLHVDSDPKKIVSDALAEQNELAGAAQTGAQLRSSNHVFAAKGFPFLPSYTSDITTGFHAAPETLDFRSAPEPARLHINQLVSRDTNAKIPELLPAGIVSGDTRMVLTNAVYFKASWDNPFEKSQTKNGAFYTLSSGTPAMLPMMHQTAQVSGATFPGGKIVELPYRDTAVVMDVIVPDDRAGLSALESKLDASAFAGMTSSLSPKTVTLSLPKFSFSSGGSVKETLGKMGIEQAFGNGADFSRISAREALEIDDVVHKTFIAVDEAGTEAAAATGLTMSDASVVIAPQMDVNADHPFVVVVRKGTQILFIGHVTDPRAS